MRKLLILSDSFPPAFAPRMGYLCKYLKQDGWDITVVTEYSDQQMFAFLEGNAKVTYINYYTARGRLLRRLQWIAVMLLDICFHYKDRRMVRVCTPILRQNDFCGILCSVYRTFPLPAAKTLARKFQLPFVADLRDIVEQFPAHEYITHKLTGLRCLDNAIINLFTRHLLSGRNKAVAAADCVVTVSPWHVDVLSRYNSHVKLIYNGFDPELFFPAPVKTPDFEIVFTGRIESLAHKNPTIFFEAVAQLLAEHAVSPDHFRIRWYTSPQSQAILQPEVQRFGLQAVNEFHEYVAADRVPDILNRSSILLILTNKTNVNGAKGIMLTKTYEYLAVAKPILCVRSDEAHLARLITEANAGLAAATTVAAYQFIKQCYQQWLDNGFTYANINHKVVDQFSRKQQAGMFAQIFDQLPDE